MIRSLQKKGSDYSEQRDFLPTTPPPTLSTNKMHCPPDTLPTSQRDWVGRGWKWEAGSGRQAPEKPEKDPLSDEESSRDGVAS